MIILMTATDDYDIDGKIYWEYFNDYDDYDD